MLSDNINDLPVICSTGLGTRDYDPHDPQQAAERNLLEERAEQNTLRQIREVRRRIEDSPRRHSPGRPGRDGSGGRGETNWEERARRSTVIEQEVQYGRTGGLGSRHPGKKTHTHIFSRAMKTMIFRLRILLCLKKHVLHRC